MSERYMVHPVYYRAGKGHSGGDNDTKLVKCDSCNDTSYSTYEEVCFTCGWREAYGFQINEAEGTDGEVQFFALIDTVTNEMIHTTTNDLVLQAMQTIAKHLNEKEMNE